MDPAEWSDKALKFYWSCHRPLFLRFHIAESVVRNTGCLRLHDYVRQGIGPKQRCRRICARGSSSQSKCFRLPEFCPNVSLPISQPAAHEANSATEGFGVGSFGGLGCHNYSMLLKTHSRTILQK